MPSITRRGLLAGATALPLVTIRTRPARAAEFTYKLGTNLPATHPLSARNIEAAARIKEATGGQLEINVFPSSQLGTDTDMLSQVRSGGVEFFTLSPLILSTFVPVTAISGVGFAFKDRAQALSAMDGALGELVRAEIVRRGLMAFPRIFDSGFRQTTSSTRPIKQPGDFAGFKIRVPAAALWTSLFKDFGAAPTTINFSEVYSALQTHVADGQENPLAIIDSAKLYEVQRFCSMTDHMWDGYWLLGNPRAYNRLPDKVKEVVQREFSRAVDDERADLVRIDAGLRQTLIDKKMEFNDVDASAFRDMLRSAGFYTDWKNKFGDQAWSTLVSFTGPLS